MSTNFSFLLDKSSIEQTLENMNALKKDRPDAKLSLQVSVDLIPDGMSYEATNMQACIVETKEMNVNEQAHNESREQVV